MIPHLAYEAPSTIQDVLGILKKGGERARILAGGTDIIPGLQQNSKRFRDIQLLVDINGVKELKGIEILEGKLTLGAGCTFSEIAAHPLTQKHAPLLAKAVSLIGSAQIRNRATVAGNFVNNSPCADSVPPLLVYGAEVHIAGLNGVRLIPLESFLVKAYRSQLQSGELVTKISLPIAPTPYTGDFIKLGRRRGVAISRITLAILAHVDSGVISELRVASGASTPIGMRFHDLEEAARGKRADRETYQDLARQLGENVLSVTGLRWSSPYKLPVLQQLFYQTMCTISKSGGV